MVELPISDACNKLGVYFMNDTVPKEMQDKIEEKANEYFYEAQANLNIMLELYGYKWENGVIFKDKEGE